MAHDATWPQRRKWTNTYYVEAANPTAAAAAVAVGWTAHLRNAAYRSVFAYEVYATDLAEGTELYAVVGIPTGQQRGTLNAPADQEEYLTKACAAVTLTVPDSRPSRKFWRPGFYEGGIVDGVSIFPSIVTAIREAFEDFIDAFEGQLRDPDGQAITGVGTIKLTTREFGRTAGSDLPEPPPVG